jgi:hypothetical protein
MRVSFETADMHGEKAWVITVLDGVQVDTWNGTRGAWQYQWTAIKSHDVRRTYGGNLKNRKFEVLVGHVLVDMPAEFGPFAPTDAEKEENPCPEWPGRAGRNAMKVRLLGHAPAEADIRTALVRHVNARGGDKFKLTDLVGHRFQLQEIVKAA